MCTVQCMCDESKGRSDEMKRFQINFFLLSDYKFIYFNKILVFLQFIKKKRKKDKQKYRYFITKVCAWILIGFPRKHTSKPNNCINQGEYQVIENKLDFFKEMQWFSSVDSFFLFKKWVVSCEQRSESTFGIVCKHRHQKAKQKRMIYKSRDFSFFFQTFKFILFFFIKEENR